MAESWTITLTCNDDGSYVARDETSGMEMMISSIVGRMLRNFTSILADKHIGSGILIANEDGDIVA